MLKTETLSEPRLAVKTKRPVGSTARKMGLEPCVKGEPGMEVSAPVAPLIASPERLDPPKVDTYKNLAVGSTPSPLGAVMPAANGDPEIAVRAPFVELSASTEMVPSVRLAT